MHKLSFTLSHSLTLYYLMLAVCCCYFATYLFIFSIYILAIRRNIIKKNWILSRVSSYHKITAGSDSVTIPWGWGRFLTHQYTRNFSWFYLFFGFLDLDPKINIFFGIYSFFVVSKNNSFVVVVLLLWLMDFSCWFIYIYFGFVILRGSDIISREIIVVCVWWFC